MTLPADPSHRFRATGRFRPWLVSLLQLVFRRVFRLLFRMTVTGQEHVPRTAPVILAGNHTGFLDGPLVWLYTPRPAHFLTKAEMFRHWFLARALGWLGQIPVHRGQPDRAALTAALDALATGGAVGVFPEGTRGAGRLESLQHGVAYLGVKSGSPIVPVACLGSAAALPKDSHRLRPRVPIRLAFGEPFTLDVDPGLSRRASVAAAAEQIHQRLRSHLAAVAAEGSPGDRPAQRAQEPA